MQLPLADTFFGLNSSQLAIIIALAALLFSVTRWRKNMISKRRSEPPRREEPAPQNRAVQSPLTVHEIASEIHSLVSDLEETARRVTAQIDNRYTRLEQLLAEADEKILRLEAAIAPHPSPSGPARPSISPPSPPASPTVSDKPSAAVVEAQRTLSRLRAERGAPAPSDDPAYKPIYVLADRGKTAREIAQELSRHQGEIELILALRQRQNLAK